MLFRLAKALISECISRASPSVALRNVRLTGFFFLDTPRVFFDVEFN